jgi:hypothetical protein
LQSILWTLTSLPFRIASHDRNLSRLIRRM